MGATEKLWMFTLLNDNYTKAKKLNRAIPVKQYSLNHKLIKIFSSPAEAGRLLGISKTAIRNNLVGLSKTSAGFIWKR